MSVGIKQKCSGKYTVLLRIYIFMLAFVAACAAIVMAIDGLMAGVAVMSAICVLLCISAVTVPMKSGKISYTRTKGCLRVERGMLIRKTVILNREDIRYSEVSRSFMERRLGICTVTFFTGGQSVKLKGINFNDGQRLNYLFSGEAAE